MAKNRKKSQTLRMTARVDFFTPSELWESLSRTPEAIPLTQAQREELDRRLNELDREGPVGTPRNELFRQIRGRAK
jgi:putative addiction module component (TIGR02574 family)